jgi:hypothetical protein
MEDTLRYFFSAVFQGFAAFVSLGLFVFFYFLQQISNRLERIETEVKTALSARGYHTFENYIGKYQNFFEYCNAVLNGSEDLEKSFKDAIINHLKNYKIYHTKLHEKIILIKYPLTHSHYAVFVNSSPG